MVVMRVYLDDVGFTERYLFHTNRDDIGLTIRCISSKVLRNYKVED
jgi:hypothetical protein